MRPLEHRPDARAGPDADLAHLPVGLDLRAISVAEGVRAALSVAVLVALNEWTGIPALGEAALGALLTCLCDPGGPIRRRMPALLTFSILGPLVTAGFSLLAWRRGRAGRDHRQPLDLLHHVRPRLGADRACRSATC